MSIRLKNNFRTQDPRLDRLVEFDERSREYPVSAVSSYEYRRRSWRLDKRLDQGAEGACVGFACAHEMRSEPVRSRRGVNAQFAREQLYWRAQQIDPWPGGSYPGAKPFYEGTSVLSGVKILLELGYIEEFRWAFSLDDLVRSTGSVGPAILGVPWLEKMKSTDDHGYIHASGRSQGGHAILCRGVDPNRERFTLSNSWGRSWGQNGDAFISFDDLEKLLNMRGEACIPLARRIRR